MAYSINGKVYTDHPMMDEVCFNCKKILNGIVIKNDVLALNCETEESLREAEIFYIQEENGYVPFSIYPFTIDELIAFGYNDINAKIYSEDRSRIPESDRSSLTDFVNNNFKNTFEEKNNYYRMLTGLPKYGSGDEYYVELDTSIIPDTYRGFLVKNSNGKYYIHEQDNKIITFLYSSGYIDEVRKEYIGSNYSYLNFLGEKAIDLYTARKAAKWDILYIPNVYYQVEDRFTELYRINRDMYVNRSYQEFFAQTGDYYDQLMILIVLCQTFSDIVTEVPEWYIRRDVFDIRSCQYFLESYGVTFFKIIPLKYQIKLVKNLNKLIKYKSSNKNIEDILEIFNSKDTKILKYWLYKKRKMNEDGTYVESDDIMDMYDLEFISSNVNDSYDSYIKDSKYRTPYDDITLMDKYWDGENSHSYTKELIMNRDFTVEATKYMSIEYDVSLENYSYQMEYFLGLLLDSHFFSDDIKIAVPSINDTTSFRLADLFLFLIVLTNAYESKQNGDRVNEIRYPVEFEGEKPTVNDETYYNWKKKYLPEIYVPKYGRVNGFNVINKEELKELLLRRHSHFRFGFGDTEGSVPKTNEEYKQEAIQWVYELGILDYINPGDTNHPIEAVSDIVDIYNNNTKIYKNLKKAIANAENADDKKTLEYVYQEMFTKKFDKEFYLLTYSWEYAKDLSEVLKDRDYILYKYYVNAISDSNIENKKDTIRLIMNDVIGTLEYYVQGFGLNYIFNFTSTESFSAIVKYISLIIGFFKSYKVYFLDPYTTIRSGSTGYENNLENSAKAIDNINEMKFTHYRADKSFTEDSVGGFNIELHKKDYAESDLIGNEIVDIYSYYDKDPLSDSDYNGLNAEDGEASGAHDVNGGVADDKLNLPYNTINGGSSYLGTLDFSDINGANADEYYKEYFIIDGGEAHDPDVMKTDAMGSQMFNYNIDGGCAGKKEFISNTVHFKIIGTELIGDIIISPRCKYLAIIEDEKGEFGLYVDDNKFASGAQFDNLKESMDTIIAIISAFGEETMDNILILLDKDLRIKTITRIVDDITYNFSYAVEEIYYDGLDGRIKQNADESAAILKNNYTANNPFAWEDLD